MASTLFFRSLKKYSATLLRFYFRTLQVNNVQAIPASGPVIFIPNHQNAFLDAILVICTSPRNPWSIARASVFKEGLVTKLLTAVQIKPVFRSRDGFSTLRNNDAIMREWVEMLSAGHDLQIFAEGNHNDPYAAGILQKGFARMTIQFKEKYPDIPLTIVPVGMHYDDHYTFRSRVLVNYGTAISVDDVLQHASTDREKLEGLTEATDKILKSLALAIPSDDDYKSKVEFLRKHRVYKKDMLDQLEADRQVLQAYPKPLPSTAKEKSSLVWKIINPIVWFGYVTNIIPYALLKSFLKKKIKDPQWLSSLKFAFGLFVLPIYYLLMVIVFYLVVQNIPATVVFGILMPLTGLWATDFLKR